MRVATVVAASHVSIRRIVRPICVATFVDINVMIVSGPRKSLDKNLI